jgi:hypothetical protein
MGVAMAESFCIIFRRYAPFTSFGGGFHGDGRVTAQYEGTARTTGSIVCEWGRGVVEVSASSGESYHKLAPSVRRIGKTNIKLLDSKVDGSSISFSAHTEGALPLIPGAPDIDTFIGITLTRSAGTCVVNGALHGDCFPNAEVFYVESPLRPIVLAHFETKGGRHTGPMRHLAGAHKDQLLTRFAKTFARG